MEKFTVHTGIVGAMNRANVDTDAIIPKQFLKSIRRTGFGENCFDAWRYLDEGQPGKPNAGRPLNPEFELNKPAAKGASILLAGNNFGCGSSREHAPWALLEYGFRAIIAPAFGDIFFNNSYKNGLLPIVLRDDEVQRLFADAAVFPGFRLTVDLAAQTVATENRSFVAKFDITPFRKQCLLNGWDDIGLTLRHADTIREFEARHLHASPWL